MIAVLDTETNWYDELMSVGIVTAEEDGSRFTPHDTIYRIISPAYTAGGMFSSSLILTGECDGIIAERDDAMYDIRRFLSAEKVSGIYAYNARFDHRLLPELGDYDWYDILRIAAYRQFNPMITDAYECFKTGRMKNGYGVEDIYRMLSGEKTYSETHNAQRDSVDELNIMNMLGHPSSVYRIAMIQ